VQVGPNESILTSLQTKEQRWSETADKTVGRRGYQHPVATNSHPGNATQITGTKRDLSQLSKAVGLLLLACSFEQSRQSN